LQFYFQKKQLDKKIEDKIMAAFKWHQTGMHKNGLAKNVEKCRFSLLGS
jgi:hypothetical protein